MKQSKPTSARALSLTRQLAEAKTQLAAAQQETKALESKKEQLESLNKHYSSAADKARDELGQIHAFLDAVPNPPARKVTPEGSHYPVDISAMTRLSVFVATRSVPA